MPKETREQHKFLVITTTDTAKYCYIEKLCLRSVLWVKC